MNRAEKLKTLRDTLAGRTQLLQQLHQQGRKDAMPYLDVVGIINVRQCSLKLMALIVYDGEIDGETTSEPLGEWLRRYDAYDAIKPQPKYDCRHTSAIGFVSGEDNQYDAEPVTLIELKYRNYSTQLLQGGTVADLRQLFHQCDTPFEQSYICLVLETDMSLYNRKLIGHETNR